MTAFIEKPPLAQAPTNLINAGIYVLETAVLDRIPTGRRVSIERETFPELVEAPWPVRARVGLLLARYRDLSQYLQAQLDILAGRRASIVPPAPEIRAGVWVATDAEVSGKLGPHSFVGREASIGGGAVVEDSVIGARSQIGADAVVRRSVVMAGAVVGSGAIVEDSVVGLRARRR